MSNKGKYNTKNVVKEIMKSLKPKISNNIKGLNKNEIAHYVKKILSNQYQVQDVLKEVPKAMRNNVMSALREKGNKMYKGGLKEYMAKKHINKTNIEGVDDEKYDRCVDKVKKQGKTKNPYAICNASLRGGAKK